MSVKSGFFNSVDGDRLYNADDLNHFFEGIVSDGIFKGYKRELEVTASSGMTVRVLTGKAIVLDKYIENTAALNLTIEGGGELPRYDAVVLNTNLENREGTIFVKQGTPAAEPEKPALSDSPNTKEMCLAYIYVSANATTIVSSDIEDVRNDPAVCGWVKLTNVSSELLTYRNNYTTTATESVIELGITEFDADNDTLFIYENGLLLEETNEYLVQSTGSEAKVHLKNAAPAGNKFTFIVMHMGM